MTNNQTIGKLFLALLVLVGIIGFQTWRSTNKSNPDQTSYQSLLNASSLKPDSVTQFTLTKGQDELALQKVNDNWKVIDYEANQIQVTNFLKQLLEPESVELIAETNARHNELGVASSSATIVSFTGDNPQQILIGIQGTDGYYVRFDKSDAVYVVPVLPSQISEPTLESWVSLTVSDLVEDDINKITINYNQKDLILERKEANWYLSGNEQPIDKNSIASLLTNLSALTANKFLTEIDRPNFAVNPYLSVTTVASTGSQQLNFYQNLDKDTSTTLVTVKDRIGFYEIANTIADNFELEESDIKFSQPSPSTNP